MLLFLENIEPVPVDITDPKTRKRLKKKQGKNFFLNMW